MDPKNFTDDQLAGQRLMVGFDGTAMNDDLRWLIGQLKVGGIILFSQNISTPEQIRELCAGAQDFARSCGQPQLLIAVDQEGGQVARLKAPFTQFSGNPSLADAADARRFARITASELQGVGINMNLAPVVDVLCEGVDSVMVKRAFGADPDWVSHLGCAVIDTFQENRIMAVAKHFPGIGRTTLDSHLVQPVLSAESGAMAEVDFRPFEAAIAHDVAGIMLSHIRYLDLDDQWPASLSSRIARDLLRDRMGYGGVVMTDDLDMKSIKGRYDMPTSIRQIMGADIDLVLICHKGPDIQQGFDELLKGVGTSPEARKQAVASVRRILSLKHKYGLLCT